LERRRWADAGKAHAARRTKRTKYFMAVGKWVEKSPQRTAREGKFPEVVLSVQAG
jgi:hypothetical protein